MRIFQALQACKTGKKDPVPFQEILPLKLKPRVSGKGDNTSEVCCLYEMSVLMACLKTNDFTQSPCAKEIQDFQKCFLENRDRKEVRKEMEKTGSLTPGERKLSHKQLNTLLKRYPNIK